MARNKKIFESDLLLLRDTFFEELQAIVVYDPDERAIENTEEELVYLGTPEGIEAIKGMWHRVLLVVLGKNQVVKNLGPENFGGVITLEQMKCSLKECALYYYLSNYQTIRFGYPRELKSPLFYNVLHENYEYLWYTKMLDQALFNAGLSSLSSDGSYYIYHHKKHHITFNDEVQGDNFFFFSENHIFNRMAQCFLAEGKRIMFNIKYGDSAIGRKHLEHEYSILHDLNRKLQLEKASIPTVKWTGDKLLLSNNWPNGGHIPDLLEYDYYEALHEIYKQLTQVSTVADFIKERKYLSIIQAIKNIIEEDLHPKGLSKQNIEELCIELLVLLQKLNNKEPFYTSVYQGQFIPSNIPGKQGKIYINNWEQAAFGMPLLFDCFHFQFNRMEQEEQPLMGEFDDLTKRMLKNKGFMDIVRDFDINFKLNFSLFHLEYMLQRLQQYMKQRFINPNANFVISFWRQALVRLNSMQL